MLLHHRCPGPGAAVLGALLTTNVYLAGLTAGVVLGLVAAGAARGARRFGPPRPAHWHRGEWHRPPEDEGRPTGHD